MTASHKCCPMFYAANCKTTDFHLRISQLSASSAPIIPHAAWDTTLFDFMLLHWVYLGRRKGNQKYQAYCAAHTASQWRHTRSASQRAVGRRCACQTLLVLLLAVTGLCHLMILNYWLGTFAHSGVQAGVPLCSVWYQTNCVKVLKHLQKNSTTKCNY